MNKNLFFAAMATLAMVSCSQEEQAGLEQNGRGIDFRAALATRATETTTANLSSFWVTAIDANNANYFTDQAFTKDGNYFTSSPAYYWPEGTVNFYAYSPSATDLGGTLTINNTTKTLADFSPAAAIADQKDFVTAHATGNKGDNEASGVELTFKHQLSQIEVKAKNANEGYVYEVMGVRIGQPISKGSFDFGTPAWTLGTDKTVYEVTYTTEKTLTATAQSIMGDGGNAMLIPQQLVKWDTTDKNNTAKGAYLSVKVNITTASGAKVYEGWAAVGIATNWEAGKKYVYVLDFSNGAGNVDPTEPEKPGEPILGQAIKFTVNVSEWISNPNDENVSLQ